MGCNELYPEFSSIASACSAVYLKVPDAFKVFWSSEKNEPSATNLTLSVSPSFVALGAPVTHAALRFDPNAEIIGST